MHNLTNLAQKDIIRIISGSPWGIVVMDSEYNIIYCNKYFAELHKLSKDDMIGHTLYDIFKNDCESATIAKTIIDKTIKSCLFAPEEVWVKDSNGCKFSMLMSGEVVGAKDGLLICAYHAIASSEYNNVTSMKSKYENVLMLLRGLSHELKNPFAAVRAVIDILLDRNDKLTKELENDLLIRAASSLDAIESSMKSLNIIGESNIKDKEKVNLGYLLSKIMSVVVLFMDVKRVRHIFYNKSDFLDLYVNVAPEDLYHIMSNLIINAAQACNFNDNATIAIFRKINGDKTHVTVGIGDNGPGITAEHQRKVFNVNFTTKKTGSGLGLMIVKSMCIKNDIDVSFETKENVGTKFYLTMRLANGDNKL